ncbi:hypothetical protein PG993_014840 [Apiospora rasikravindrae]|uniref:WSC domain-containing protein n=1 Tax=Apiospora rasikravindrae TaxID=990691 RepID=A0ABR1RNW0_9PEZI
MGDPYTLLGCYVDQSPNRTLPHTAFQGMPTNCATVCHALCNAPEYQATYFGLEYGTECYCGGGDLATFQQAASPAECNKPCPANASEMCGSDWRLSLYRILDTTLNPSPAATAPPAGPSSTGAGEGNNGTTGTSGDDTRSDGAGGKSNLTGGQIAGIGVAAFVIVALVAGLVMFLVRRRQQRGQKGRRLARPGTGTQARAAGPGAAETEPASGGAQIAGASGSAVARAGDSSNNSREGGRRG